MPEQPPLKPRRPWLAALLSFVTPGLGHVYAGSLARGLLALAALWTALLALVLLSLVAPHPLLRLAPFGILLVGFLALVADAWRVAARAGAAYRLRAFNRWYVYVGVFLLVGFILQPLYYGWIKGTVVRAFHIPSGNMSPAILPGDYLYVVPRLSGPVRRADILTYEQDGIHYLQRVVGLPGDTLQMRDKILYVNGQPQQEPYVHHMDPETDPSSPDMLWQREHLRTGTDAEQYHPSRDNWGPLVVPADRYFILGDNRDNSYDGRYRGFVRREQLMGRPAWIYFSRDPETGAIRWSRLGHGLR